MSPPTQLGTGTARRIFDYRDLGTKDATNGDYIAHVIRANGRKNPDEVQQWHIHECDFQFVYVLNGWATFEYAAQGEKTIRGDHILQIQMIPHREIACSEDFEVLEIVAPADQNPRRRPAARGRGQQLRRSI